MNDLVGNGKSQPASFVFGSVKKGVKTLSRSSSAMPFPVSLNDYLNIVKGTIFFNLFRTHRNSSIFRGSIHSIEQYIEQHLFNLFLIQDHRG